MALGLTQPLTEMSTRNISWGGKGDRCVGMTTLPPSCADCLEIWVPHLLEPSGPVQACNGIALQYICFLYLAQVSVLVPVTYRFDVSKPKYVETVVKCRSVPTFWKHVWPSFEGLCGLWMILRRIMNNLSPEGKTKRYSKTHGHTQGCRVTSNPIGVLRCVNLVVLGQ